MKQFIQLYIIALLLISCANKHVEQPVWLNQKPVVVIPIDSLIFCAANNDWKISLQGFIQPIPVQLKKTNKGFVIQLVNTAGITEGRAILTLAHKGNTFYYDIILKNKISQTKHAYDFRTPKTVNTDSSLQQHRVIYSMDEWRNILPDKGSLQYFAESIIAQSSKVITRRAQENNPLSAYYVQAGSCTSISIQSIYNKKENVFVVSTIPLKDVYGNMVANGTIIVFEYSDGQTTYQMNSTVLNGCATVKIPDGKKTYRVRAKVDKVASPVIKLISI